MNAIVSKIISIILAILSIFMPNIPDNNQDGNNESDTNYEENYEVFTGELDAYEYENKPVETISFDYAACMSVYKTNNTSQQEFKDKFEEVFGFQPTYEIKCKLIGTFIIDGYDKPTNVYHYTIEDYTYELLTQDFYTIERKFCTDGSPWVGFPVPGNLDTMDTSERVWNLVDEMNRDFLEWTGYDEEFIESHSDNFCFDRISVAGYMRTKDGQVTEVIFRYTRAFDLPIESLENQV